MGWNHQPACVWVGNKMTRFVFSLRKVREISRSRRDLSVGFKLVGWPTEKRRDLLRSPRSSETVSVFVGVFFVVFGWVGCSKLYYIYQSQMRCLMGFFGRFTDPWMTQNLWCMWDFFAALQRCAQKPGISRLFHPYKWPYKWVSLGFLSPQNKWSYLGPYLGWTELPHWKLSPVHVPRV